MIDTTKLTTCDEHRSRNRQIIPCQAAEATSSRVIMIKNTPLHHEFWYICIIPVYIMENISVEAPEQGKINGVDIKYTLCDL